MIGFGKSTKWKYATFAALGVLALIIATPQAMAATTNGSTDITKSIAEIVRNIQTLLTQSNSIATTTAATQQVVTNSEKGLPGIQGKLDELQSNTGVLFTDVFSTRDDPQIERQVEETEGKLMEINFSVVCSFSTPDNNVNKNFAVVELNLDQGDAESFDQFFSQESTTDRVIQLSTGPIVAFDSDTTSGGFDRPTYKIHCLPGTGNGFDHLTVNAWGHTLP